MSDVNQGWCVETNCFEEGRLRRKDPAVMGIILCDKHAAARGFDPAAEPVDREEPRAINLIETPLRAGEGELPIAPRESRPAAAAKTENMGEPPMATNKRTRGPAKAPKRIEEVDDAGNVLREFPSVKAAVEVIGGKPKTIYQAITKRLRFMGKHWLRYSKGTRRSV